MCYGLYREVAPGRWELDQWVEDQGQFEVEGDPDRPTHYALVEAGSGEEVGRFFLPPERSL